MSDQEAQSADLPPAPPQEPRIRWWSRPSPWGLGLMILVVILVILATQVPRIAGITYASRPKPTPAPSGAVPTLSGQVYSQALVAGRDFANADLSGALLAHLDLRGKDFQHANAAGVVFAGSLLNGVNFAHANLRGANLRDACLRGAILTGAELAGADFTGADVTGAMVTSTARSGAIRMGLDREALGMPAKLMTAFHAAHSLPDPAFCSGLLSPLLNYA